MRAALFLAASVAGAGVAVPALAADHNNGHWRVKLLATAVMPDGKIASVKVDPGLPAGAQTKASDNYVPTLAIEYFLNRNVSVETICCITEHHVNGTGSIAGYRLVKDAKLIPATVTLKYHFNAGGISPYVGVGPSYFIWFGEKPGATAATFSTTQHLSDRFGVALQGGIDVPINDKGLSLSFDAKRYFIDTKGTWRDASGAVALQTVHNIDPWVLSAGVGFRF